MLFLGAHGSPHLDETAQVFRELGRRARAPDGGGRGGALSAARRHRSGRRRLRAARRRDPRPPGGGRDGGAGSRRRRRVPAGARRARSTRPRTEPLVRIAAGRGPRTPITYVLACGPWLPDVLPLAVGSRIRATRQELLYFGVPAGDARFGVDAPAGVDRLRRRRLRHPRPRCARLQGRHRPARAADRSRHRRSPRRRRRRRAGARVPGAPVPGAGRSAAGRRSRLPVREHLQRRLPDRRPSDVAERLDCRRRLRPRLQARPGGGQPRRRSAQRTRRRSTPRFALASKASVAARAVY